MRFDRKILKRPLSSVIKSSTARRKGFSVTIEELAKSEGIWNIDERNHSDLVLKSSVRISRNLSGYTFAHKMKKEAKDEISKSLIESIHQSSWCENCVTYSFEEITGKDKNIFLERNLISNDNVTESVLVLSENQNIYFILNSVDHMELVTSLPGFGFDSMYVLGKKVITSLEKKMDFAFSPRFGYLTSDPEKSGTGMVLSIVLHLAELIYSERLNRLTVDLEKNGLGMRSSWIDGYYEIYNKTSVGKSEKSLYETTLELFEHLIDRERHFRSETYGENRKLIEDKVWRSYGILLSCRMVSLFEALKLLSNVRLGISLGIISYVSIRDINLLLHYIQDYHLRKRYNIRDDSQKLEEVRANFIRDYLKEVI
jgi:protein arginine kinase